ncbi:hypothetical protein BHE74_00000767 [Ensete ventricosum]|nr:hypothetical protein BHE74_00000767 [Ensete ventricosum]RZR88113.1 hypothetical protein BHM03_00015639 [Ensete ventricosum]
MFVGSISNLSSLVREYGLCGKTSNEALLVIEAYRTLRDRGPYPADKVVKDLAGSFAFVVYDNKTGAVFAALSADGGVPLHWGIAADGSVVICDDVEIMKGSCAKSYAPFPTGMRNLLWPRVRQVTATQMTTTKWCFGSGCMFHSEGGLRSFEHPMNRMKAMPRVDSEGAMCGASFMVDASSEIAAIPRDRVFCRSGFLGFPLPLLCFLRNFCSSSTMTVAELGIQSSYTNGGLASAAAAEKKKARDSDRRRRRRKQKKNNKPSSAPADEAGDESDGFEGGAEGHAKENSDPRPQVEVSVEVEYVPEKADVEESFLADFKSVLEKFSFQDAASAEDEDKKDEAVGNAAAKKGGDSDSEEEEQEAQQKEKGLSNKKKKVNPKLLVFLKSYRNTVPGSKAPYQAIHIGPSIDRYADRSLPGGTAEIDRKLTVVGRSVLAEEGRKKKREINLVPLRDLSPALRRIDCAICRPWAYIEKEDSKKLKQKQRERMQPKMGKMDIDYQVECVIMHQVVANVKLREMKPGMLSRELKEALGMPEGAPPPWLINMQYGRPLYGDVFGVQQQEQHNYEEEPVDRSKHWGDLEEEEEEEMEDEEEEEEEEMEEEELEAGIQSVDSLSRFFLASFFSSSFEIYPWFITSFVHLLKITASLFSTPTGVETPDVIDLRKQQRKEPEKPLYQVNKFRFAVCKLVMLLLCYLKVLEEKEERVAPGTLLGTTHTYVLGAQEKMAAAKRQAANKRKRKEKEGKSKKKDFKF